MSDFQVKVLRITCRNCKQQTNHNVKARYNNIVPFEIDNDSHVYEEEHPYMILQCGGCDTIAFLHMQPVDGEDSIFHIYPDPGKPSDNTYFLSLNEQWKFPEMIRDLYMEVVSAFLANSNVLAGLGLRTLVEALCIDQKISGANLMEKIKNLEVKGLISSAELPILDKLRQIGNVSAHEIKGMPMEMLEHAIQIVNHILKSVYILPALDEKIKL